MKPQQLDTLKRNGVAMLDASTELAGFCTTPIYATAPAQENTND